MGGLMLTLCLLAALGSVLGAGCPPGKPRVYCFVDPCLSARQSGCSAYPSAECRSNYCGGCYAEWFYGGQRVNCNAFPGGNACPPGVPEWRCLLDPCDRRITSCPKYPGAICRSNYCGGCNAVWHFQGRTVTDCNRA